MAGPIRSESALGARTLENLSGRVIGVGSLRPQPYLDGAQSGYPGPTPKWAETVGIYMTDPLRALERIREVEAQNRAYLKQSERWSRSLQETCRCRLEMSDCLGLREAEPLDRELYYKKGGGKVVKANSIALAAAPTGSFHFNAVVRNKSLWSRPFGSREIKLLLFGAALPKAGGITAAAGTKQLKSFLENVYALNADEGALYRVISAHLYGSYLKGAERCGDVDVCVDIQPRHRMGEMTADEFAHRAQSMPRPNGISIVDYHHWPQISVMRRLKAGANRIVVKGVLPVPIHEIDQPLEIYHRDTPRDVTMTITQVLATRAKWQTAKMQEYRLLLADAAHATNTDPKAIRAQVAAEEREQLRAAESVAKMWETLLNL